MKTLQVDKYKVDITHPDKIYFPHANITKGELVEYYRTIAPIMLPHIIDHPLTLVRYPDGISGEGFYQKDAPDYFPSWISRVKVPKKEGGDVHYAVCKNAATLVYLANYGTIVFHAWTSRADKLHIPDRIVFDFDPSVDDFQAVRHGALLLQELCEDLGVTPFVMTSGSKGLHVTIPIKRRYNYEVVAAVADGIAHKMVQLEPQKFTMEIRKEKRGNKIFIDTLRNRWSATSVAPYSVRALQGAPIAAPIEWKEVHTKKLNPQKYTIKNIMTHVAKHDDPWLNFSSHAINLGPIAKVVAPDHT